MRDAIQIENVGKLYRLGEVGTGTLSHDLKRWWAKSRGKEDPFAKIGTVNDRTKIGQKNEYVWALQDISFNVAQGNVLGVIGKNGAGKSTLLKILSRITAPSTGSIKIKGRIGSLLEVGTGFHPEMTGRENVFMNGTVLGMRKHEIDRKFDEIVDFAGVSKYVDTPVKRYSSGMMIRLGFAVAAFLEPEILIVDEVLAVGDAEFQNKAIGKMKDVSRGEGRTVIFVSHNMGAIKNLCTAGVVLKNGKVVFADNNIEKVVDSYYETTLNLDNLPPIGERKDRQGNGNVSIQNFELLGSINNTQLELGKPFRFRITYHSVLDNFVAKIFMSINNGNGECVLFMDSNTIANFPVSIGKEGEVEISISSDFGLPVGRYFINIAFFANNVLADYVQSAILMDVVDGLFYETGKVPASKTICYVKQEWIYKNI